MERIAGYLAKAEDAEQLARAASSHEQRESFLRIAAVWRDLARTWAKLHADGETDPPNR